MSNVNATCLTQYQTFKTRVERIKVDVVRRSKVVDDEPDEHGSFFYEALEEWKDLNMTRNFKDFAREMTPLVKSLPSIIHHKDEIVNILEKHLKVKDSLALDGLLEYVLLFLFKRFAILMHNSIVWLQSSQKIWRENFTPIILVCSLVYYPQCIIKISSYQR